MELHEKEEGSVFLIYALNEGLHSSMANSRRVSINNYFLYIVVRDDV